jgi:uncharacterized protein YacL
MSERETILVTPGPHQRSWVEKLFGRNTIGDLTAVLIGVGAVVALAIAGMIIARNSAEGVVAIASASFGVIGSVVGAYFGVKVGTASRDRESLNAQAFALNVPPADAERALETIASLSALSQNE